jgi:hypothetical protein
MTRIHSPFTIPEHLRRSPVETSMNLEEELLREHSRKHAEKLARWVGTDSNRLTVLMRHFLTGEFLTSQRAAWVVTIIAERHPMLFCPYLKRMLSRMQEPGVHDAVKRSVVRILQDIEIPDNLLGTTATLCFEQLSSAEAPIAVKCFSMTVLAHIAEREPELGRELRLVIEQQLPFAGAGFRARARETLKAIQAHEK